ncbi:hypothetical protein C8J57DRAFT_1483761 [Mycena rebaudengoi]|nr:hypothetical protein C8J57DRAFT_1483761 [Mycena rebaudengoi]
MCTSLLVHATTIRAGQLFRMDVSEQHGEQAGDIRIYRIRATAHLARYPARDGVEERGDALAVQEGPWHGDGCGEGCAPHSGGGGCALHEADGGSARVGRGALVSGSGDAALHEGQDGAPVRRPTRRTLNLVRERRMRGGVGSEVGGGARMTVGASQEFGAAAFRCCSSDDGHGLSVETKTCLRLRLGRRERWVEYIARSQKKSQKKLIGGDKYGFLCGWNASHSCRENGVALL